MSFVKITSHSLYFRMSFCLIYIRNQFSFPNESLIFARVYKSSIIIAFLLFQSFSSIWSQQHCQKQVKYTIAQSTGHAVDVNCDVNSLSASELLRGKEDAQLIEESHCIDQNGNLIKTKYITTASNSFYPHNVKKVVDDGVLVQAYDNNDMLIDEIDYSSDTFYTNNAMLDAAQIVAYGVGPDYQQIINHSLNGNFENYWSEGDKYFFTDPTMDLIIDPTNNYLYINNYDEKGDLADTYVEAYKDFQGVLLPEFTIRQTYTTFSSGCIFQTSITNIYTSYEIIEGDQNVLEKQVDPNFDSSTFLDLNNNEQLTTKISNFQLQERVRPKIKVIPNPATDQVQLDFGNLWYSQYIQIALLNMQGQVLQMMRKSEAEKLVTMDISPFPAGIYMLRVGVDKNQIIEKLIIAK